MSQETIEQLNKNNPPSPVLNKLELSEGIWMGPEGLYWSNLEKDKNQEFINDLDQLGAYQTMKKHFPQHEEVIFSPRRMAGIATLDIKESDTILDAGCMWGAISIPLARTNAYVIAVDQTLESLRFLNKRKKEEELNNLEVVRSDLKQLQLAEKSLDKVIVNGVLEWIPEVHNIEVVNLDKQRESNQQQTSSRPVDEQKEALKKLCASLKDDGTLYLAIENRFDFFYFLGQKEPHCGIRFFSFLPRWLQNIISKLIRKREFRNWTYSRRGLIKLLNECGFQNIKIYYGFPDYREPALVLTQAGMKYYRYCSPIGETSKLKKIAARLVEEIIFKRLRLTFFAPTFIIHAGK